MPSSARYSFITTFSVTAPHAAVWDALLDFKGWKSWWGAVRTISIAGEKPSQTIALTVGHFGYYLSFAMHTERTQAGKEISFSSTGDLEGSGRFIFDATASVTTVAFCWNVATTKKWMNAAAPVLYPFFIVSHGFVMREFVYGFARYLDARVVSCRNTGRKVS
jgi:hypothetical protein